MESTAIIEGSTVKLQLEVDTATFDSQLLEFAEMLVRTANCVHQDGRFLTSEEIENFSLRGGEHE